MEFHKDRELLFKNLEFVWSSRNCGSWTIIFAGSLFNPAFIYVLLLVSTFLSQILIGDQEKFNFKCVDKPSMKIIFSFLISTIPKSLLIFKRICLWDFWEFFKIYFLSLSKFGFLLDYFWTKFCNFFHHFLIPIKY